MSKITACHYSK